MELPPRCPLLPPHLAEEAIGAGNEGPRPGPRPHPPELLPLTLPCRFTGSQQLPWDSLEGRGVWGGQ